MSVVLTNLTNPLRPTTRLGPTNPPLALPGSTKGETMRWDYSTSKASNGVVSSHVYEGVAHDGCVLHVVSFGTSNEPGAWWRDLHRERIKPATAKRIQAQHAANLAAAEAAVAERIAFLQANPDVFKSKGY